jgi:protein-tyrosine phosphatase
MIRILFVCMGNICRSPIAEGVVRVLAKRAGVSSSVEVDSAGTHGNHAGEPPDQRARKVAASRGYDLSGLRARRVKDRDFGDFDRILAMDKQNLASLRRSCPTEHLSKLGLFLDYAQDLAVEEIPDPYYGGFEGFEKVLDLCEQAAQGLLKSVEELGPENDPDRR